MQSLHDLADDFTTMLAAGRHRAAADKYWSPDISSVEPANLRDGTPAVVVGFTAARAKLVRWQDQNAVEDVMIDGPFVTGDRFALFIDMEIVRGDTGTREPFSKIGVYTVCGGKIVEERYFYE